MFDTLKYLPESQRNDEQIVYEIIFIDSVTNT